MAVLKSAVLVTALSLGAFPLSTATPTAQEIVTIVQTVSGAASWYGGKFHGRRTANGETYNMHALTAAHPNLPFGTEVLVTNEINGKSVIVRINDRGPFVGNRVIDLSHAAANRIGMVNDGVARVKLEIIG